MPCRRQRFSRAGAGLLGYNEAIGFSSIHYGTTPIMPTFTLRSFLTVAAAVLAVPVMAHAQAPAGDAANTPPPPQTMKLEEGEAPEVTITPPDTEKKITEKKQQGKVTEVKVQTGRTTYYAKPNDTPGSMRGDAQSDSSRPAQFQVGEFGPPKERNVPEPVQTLQPAPAKK